jgi:hypothetical protein
VISFVITQRVVSSFCFTDVCGEACYGAGLERRYDRGEYFSMGVLSHGVGAADVLVDGSEEARVIGQEGRVTDRV